MADSKKAVLIRGAGEMASGIAVRLFNSGFKVFMSEIEKPSCIRRKVSFSEAVYDGKMEVEGIKAVLAQTPKEAELLSEEGAISVLIDPGLDCLTHIKPYGLVDATLAKKNMGIDMMMAPKVIGVGPGFYAGADCHVVIESMRGHDLGRLIYKGTAEKNTGIPGDIVGFTRQRVVYAPVEGIITLINDIGDIVEEGQTIAKIGDCSVTAPIAGALRGIIRDGYHVKLGMKIGDIDPRGARGNCFTVSDKARALGGSVLEALLHQE